VTKAVENIGRRRRVRRARGERGSVLVEAAFITPVLFFLLFSVLEFGMAFRDYLAVANTTRDGARAASVFGNDSSADFDILQSIADSSNVINRRDIQRIVVYKASGPNTPVPTICTTAAPGSQGIGVCNIYTASALDLAESEFGCRSDRNLDKFWCPTATTSTTPTQSGRKVAMTGTNGPPDYIGVWIKVNHTWVTGLFGRSLTFTDSTVMRMEPQAAS
jgi:hypothetical protein